jgi:hypothetical protein
VLRIPTHGERRATVSSHADPRLNSGSRLIELGALLTIAGGLIAPAAAQTASDSDDAPDKPDKWRYTLSNPTPENEMRSFCTDRPPKANLPCTVDAGHFQYEADAFNWSRLRTGGVTTNSYLVSNPTFKLGVADRLDLELNIPPVETVVTTSPFGRTRLTGVGDLVLRAKANLAGAEGGDFQAALIPYLKAPTAQLGIGNRAAEGGVIAPISFALPQDFTLLFDPEIDVLRNAKDFGRHANFQGLANISRPLGNDVTAYVELWGAVNSDPSRPTKQASLDLSLAWVAWKKLPNLQFDIGANIGLTEATPRLQLYTGVSQRF